MRRTLSPLAILALVLLLAACGGAPPAPSPTALPSPTVAASPSPVPSPSVAPTIFPSPTFLQAEPAAATQTAQAAKAATPRATPGTPGTPATATITLSARATFPGDQLRIAGSGFAPGEEVVLRVETAAAGRVLADGQGAFATTVSVPCVARLCGSGGNTEVIATGQASGKEARQAVILLMVPPPLPAGGTATRTPAGTAPVGWQTYRGSATVPFALYYPPGWTVDESRAGEGRIYFYGPGVTQPYENALWVLIATTGVRDPNGNIDVLRDTYFNSDIKGAHPEAGVDSTRYNTFAGITFAALGATFNANTELCYAYIGLGLNDGVPWRFRLNSRYGDYAGNLATYFTDMIGSLNIYANP